MKVVLTDRADYVELLDHNIKINQEILLCDKVSARPLNWGNLEEVSINMSTLVMKIKFVADQRSFKVLQTRR